MFQHFLSLLLLLNNKTRSNFSSLSLSQTIHQVNEVTPLTRSIVNPMPISARLQKEFRPCLSPREARFISVAHMHLQEKRPLETRGIPRPDNIFLVAPFSCRIRGEFTTGPVHQRTGKFFRTLVEQR